MPVARLTNNSCVQYIEGIIASGTTKNVYLIEDKKSALLIYKKLEYQKDKINIDRLKRIFTQFNLTISKDRGGAAKDENEAFRMKQVFGWPTGITITPRLGYLSPFFPDRFWFMNDPSNLPVKDPGWRKAEKKAAWFSLKRAWKTLAKKERGNFKEMLQVCLLLSHGISRLHLMGLAHSDISPNNVLVDPLADRHGTGWPGCLIIDLDTLVVPGFYPAAVLGTKGYIAPEVLATSKLSAIRERKMPSIGTDKHALSVMIYELLLKRHPLYGPKFHDDDEEKNDFIAYGAKALFIENPSDTSNRPKKIDIPYLELGKPISQCIERAFIAGLHNPYQRPQAIDWERAFWKTLDLLHPCNNTTCLWRWYVCEKGHKSKCPWCGSSPATGVPELLYLNSNGVPLSDGSKLVCWHGRRLFKWHAEENTVPLPFEDKNPYAEVLFDTAQKRWMIFNHRLPGLSITSPYRKEVPLGNKVFIERGVILKLGSLKNSRMVRFMEN